MWQSSPSQDLLPCMRHDVPLMCHSEFKTARWEVHHNTGSPQGTPRSRYRERKTFLCIHEYHSSERGRRTKATEANDFPVSSSVPLRFLCPLVVAWFITRKTRMSTWDKGPYCQCVFFLFLLCPYYDIVIVSIFSLTMAHMTTCV